MEDLVLEIPSKANLTELRETAEAACRTLELAEKHDLPFDDDFNVNLPPPVDPVPTRAPAVRSSPSLLVIYNMIQEYGSGLNATAEEVRNTVFNKLLLETENPDAKVRIKALELLGKIPEIGLFTDPKLAARREKPDSDVAEQLKARLHELRKSVEGVYETAEEPTKESVGGVYETEKPTKESVRGGYETEEPTKA